MSTFTTLAIRALLGNVFSHHREVPRGRVGKPRRLNLERLTSRELMAGDIGVVGIQPIEVVNSGPPISANLPIVIATAEARAADRTTGEVTGRVYFDANGDGKRQSTEHGIMGARVHIKGYAYEPKSLTPGRLVEFTTITDDKGRYSFYDMPPGEYTITQDDLSGLGSPALRIGTEGGTIDDRGIRLIVRAGVETLYNDFMYKKTANMEGYGDNDAKPDPIPMPWPGITPVAKNKITGRVYFDTNGDGKRQDSEAGIANVKIRIFGVDNTPRSTMDLRYIDQTVTTNEQGCYTFDNLPPGEYTITQLSAEGSTNARLRVGTEGGSIIAGGIKVNISGGKESMYNDFMYSESSNNIARSSLEASGEVGSSRISADEIMAAYTSMNSSLNAANELVESRGIKVSTRNVDRLFI